MSGDPRPLLALASPITGPRTPQTPAVPPRVSRPGPARQRERLTPQFQALVDAFDAQRAALSAQNVDEVDPELVLVFDLAGTIKDFRNAIERVEGLQFLAEYLAEDSDPDDDFHMVHRTDGRTSDAVQHSLYLVMSNAQAAGQLVSLFERWQRDRTSSFEHGLNKFRTAFEQLRAIRRWGAEDRVRETGLLEEWEERLELVGQSVSSVLVEIELWFRRDSGRRAAADARLDEVVRAAGGEVHDRAQIAAIGYHAALVELPVQQVQAVLTDGADAIELLTTDEIMFVSPYTPMTVATSSAEPQHAAGLATGALPEGLPRIALLDGLPFANHDSLVGRLVIDDPDDLASAYPVLSRQHGTAMASLIIHGDLNAGDEPLDRPLYVRPILQPHPHLAGHERVPAHTLLTDLLHRAVRRIVEGEGSRPAAAPSVRIVNLSIGAESRALIRRMSPAGRLLDWLAVAYNLLFVVSAGNHHRRPLQIPADAATDVETARVESTRAARNSSRSRGVLSPGDALNVLTVGATHHDHAGQIELPDTVWELTEEGAPALYGGVGPGVGRSIKPDLHHSGGRSLHLRPVVAPGADAVELLPAETSAVGPGHRVATPDRTGRTDAVRFTHGTSNAAALVSRAASQVLEVLEAGPAEGDPSFPDALYHPVLARALLVHATSWADRGDRLRAVLTLDPQRARRELTWLLGYGHLDPERSAAAATNRAVLIAGGSIEPEKRHTYRIPLPESLRAKAEWHRVTVTLAYMAPTTAQLARYRGTRLFFEAPDSSVTAGTRRDAEHNAVRRGSLQHEIFEGDRAMVFGDGGSLALNVECMNDATAQPAGRTIRYGLVVSIETATQTSVTVHDEVRARLQAAVREEARTRAATRA